MLECLQAAVAASAAPAEAARLLSEFREATGDFRGAKEAAFLRLRALQTAGWHSDGAAVEQATACFEQLCRYAASGAADRWVLSCLVSGSCSAVRSVHLDTRNPPVIGVVASDGCSVNVLSGVCGACVLLLLRWTGVRARLACWTFSFTLLVLYWCSDVPSPQACVFSAGVTYLGVAGTTLN